LIEKVYFKKLVKNKMRKALIVGINHYDNDKIQNLNGCINDAIKITNVLSKNYDKENLGTPNFHCETLLSSIERDKKTTRAKLQRHIQEFFKMRENIDIALFYFAGHGFENNLGGYLVTQDASGYEEGVSFNDVMLCANKSSIPEIVIILDCCNSGNLGNIALTGQHVTLRKGISVLTASSVSEESMEKNGSGIFTDLLINALQGGNTDILGNVKITHLYEHADRMLGPWNQRPTFKTNSSCLTVLRKAEPKIDHRTLKKTMNYFKIHDYFLRLDPSFEPSSDCCIPENAVKFGHLQTLVKMGLVKPYGAEHMYYAAINSKGCQLTLSGQEYWQLVKNNLI